MILKALTLENFKGIREPVRVEFAPLTLLFGPNNAGKSTIVQALMYAREVLERNNCDVGRTQLGGDVVDLGGFENLVYAHDLSRPVRMRFELDLRGVRSPQTSDWIREHEFENQASWQYSNAPKELEVDSAQTVWSRLKEVWVEIEIAGRDAHETNWRAGPVVRAYSVGKGADVYATISLADGEDQAHLSYFNFGIYPFGTRYAKGDATDFEWDLERVVREWIRDPIQEQDWPEINLKKGASVAMAGEEIGSTANVMPRQHFDDLVSRIVTGADEWGDPTLDDETGEQNPKYKKRQALVARAQRLGDYRQLLTDARARMNDPLPPLFREFDAPTPVETSYECVSPENVSETAPQEGPPTSADNDGADAEETRESDGGSSAAYSEWEDRRSLFDDERVNATEELDSWMLDLFDALLVKEYVPLSPDYATPLKLSGSALPEWGRLSEFDPDVWIPDQENEFWENPAFVDEYLKGLLTAVIAGPGELLVRALKDSVYISPFREMPPRYYQPARSPEQRRWANGLAAWDWLLLEDKSFAAEVNDWLTGKNKFDAGYDIDVRHYRELEVDDPVLAALTVQEQQGDLDLDWVREQLLKLPEGRRLKIRDLRSGVSLFPQDLGVGISQVIPVIVAALHNKTGVVAVEEPESNIHPAFQVVLADLFLTQTKANPEVLFLVETHSEYLMLRCLRRIRETREGGIENGVPDVWPDDIAVHFVEAGDDGPRIHRIRIEDNGEFLDPWPQGFFPERMKEIYGDDL